MSARNVNLNEQKCKDKYGPFKRSVQNRYFLSLTLSLNLTICPACTQVLTHALMPGNLVCPSCFSAFLYYFFPLHVHLLILVTHPLFWSCECAQKATFSLFRSSCFPIFIYLKIRNIQMTKTRTYSSMTVFIHTHTHTDARTIVHRGTMIIVWPVCNPYFKTHINLQPSYFRFRCVFIRVGCFSYTKIRVNMNKAQPNDWIKCGQSELILCFWL